MRCVGACSHEGCQGWNRALLAEEKAGRRVGTTAVHKLSEQGMRIQAYRSNPKPGSNTNGSVPHLRGRESEWQRLSIGGGADKGGERCRAGLGVQPAQRPAGLAAGQGKNLCPRTSHTEAASPPLPRSTLPALHSSFQAPADPNLSLVHMQHGPRRLGQRSKGLTGLGLCLSTHGCASSGSPWACPP